MDTALHIEDLFGANLCHWVRTSESITFLNEHADECHLAQLQRVNACDALRVVSQLSLVHHRDCVFPMTESVCRWKPFWVPSVDKFFKSYLEDGNA